MKNILILIVAVFFAFTASMALGADNSPSGPEVPTSITGVVIKPDIDVCMDTAITHILLHHDAQKSIVGTRLSPRNEEIRKQLKKFEGKRTRVTVMGNWKQGTECRYLSVYSVEISKEKVVTRGDNK